VILGVPLLRPLKSGMSAHTALLLKTSDAELYCACRTRHYVTWSVATTGRSASSHYRRHEICRIQLGQGWYPIRDCSSPQGLGAGLRNPMGFKTQLSPKFSRDCQNVLQPVQHH